MRKLLILSNSILLLILFTSNSFAQSDYKIVENFKTKQNQIEQSIKNIDSLAQFSDIEKEIFALRDKYEDNRDLLDKSLYPDDYSSSINKLFNDLKARRGDFSQITTLQSHVVELQSQMDLLNKKNEDLIAQIQQLQDLSSNDKKDIDKLKRSIASLRYSLTRRDRIIMSMLDNILPANYKDDQNLTSKEKQQIYSEAKKNNIIANIQRSIDDNIKFLEVTNLNSQDISALKKQETEFAGIWKTVGPQLAEIYISKRHRKTKFAEIDSSFTRWDKAIDNEAWNSIHQLFANNSIDLIEFTNGPEFTQAVSNYLEGQIQRSSKNENQSRANYTVFVDSVWNAKIRAEWIPYLAQNNLITANEQELIQNKIKQWDSVLNPGTFNWTYALIAAVVLLLIGIFLFTRSSKKTETKLSESTT